MVVNQYREEDPYSKKHGTWDLHTLIEYTLEHLDCSQKVKVNNDQAESVAIQTSTMKQ